MAIIQSKKSISPYFDDFDPDKDYVQVLFRPGYPVQARELTTLQTFIREQIGKFGDSVFKEGSAVKNVEVTMSDDVYELPLTSSANSVFPASGANTSAVLAPMSSFIGKIISNNTGTVKARVMGAPTAINTSNYVGNIYIKYITENKFDSEGGYIYVATENNPTQTQLLYNTFSVSNKAVTVSTTGGVYYVNNTFVRAPAETIVINNTGEKPTIDIGFIVEETIVTQNEDASLYDNARGSTNEGAPGAHRYKFSLKLASKVPGSAGSTNFFRIATYIDGIRQSIPKIDKQFGSLMEVLARRTFDESGNYTVRPFKHTVSAGDSEENFLLNIGPSKAYVKGYEIDLTGPSKVYFDKGLENTKTTKNFKVPFTGPTSLTVTGVSGNLPGSTSGSVFLPTARLQLKNSSSDVIGIARAWAINDEFKKGEVKTKLYIYDVKMFSGITTNTSAFDTGLATGNDVYSGKVRGRVFTGEGTPGSSNFVVIDANGRFRPNQSIASDTTGLSATIQTVTNYQLSDVATITSASGFSSTVVANSVENENALLAGAFDKHLKTFKDGSTNIIDNDFFVLENTGGTATVVNAENGFYDSTRVDDQTEITKNLKFAYVKVKGGDHSVGNYGWLSSDKEVSLHYPDVHKVYQVNETTGNSFETGRFARVSVITAGVIPQGSIVTGSSSGSKAIVALQNSTSSNLSTLSTDASYHATMTGTGSTNTLEVVFTRGTSFTANELLTVKVPGTETEYTYQVTYISATEETGNNVTGNFMLDSGQRKEFYDIGRLVRKDNVPAPNNDIVLFYSYLEADPTTAHYYSVDSLSNEDFFGVDTRYYGSAKEIKPKLVDDGVDLRNVLDFRLRVQPVTSVANSPFNFASRTFYDQDRLVPNTKFTTDFIEYLGRKALVSLEKTGVWKIVLGAPSTDPKKPQPTVDGMPVFWLSIPPAVRYPEDEVDVEVVDNKRYTMRDIGKIDQRVDRLEETVALTALESQALHDDLGGRTKSGFVVDDFSLEKNNPNSPSDPSHPEYNASVDVLEKELIPAQTSGVPIEMDISSSVNTSSFFTGYVMNAFTEEAFSTQMEATTSQKINPYATWVFQGDITMTPDEDNWRIRKDDYFTNLYGDLKPFEGSAAEFQNFSTITTSSPGGVSVTQREWIGRPRTSRATSGRTTTTTTTRAQRETTTTSFDSPRVIAGTRPITTQTGTEVIENPQDYFMRSLTVSYSVNGLKPNTVHSSKFGDKTIATGLTTDNEGKLSGTFTIPAQTFKAGIETFEINDTETRGNSSSSSATFTSIGHLDTFRTVANISSSTTTINTRDVVTGVTSVTRPEADRGDPIAQMFTLPITEFNETQTSVVTSIDLWFSTVDVRVPMNKVKVEIREAVNGYPGGNQHIIGSSDFIELTSANETTSISAGSATNIKFKAPVVLRGNTEYAIVIKSPSDIMSVYVADLGETLIDGTGIHTEQPNVGGYFGSFFTSQNATTWNAEQNKDLTYRLKRAKFDTNTTGTVTLVNKVQDSGYNKGDIGAYNQGLTMETYTNSSYVKVFHPNHGLHYNNAQVTISGVRAGTYNNVSDSDLNGTFTVYYPTLDSYFIKTNGAANANGKIQTGIFTTFATQDIVYDLLATNFMLTKEDRDDVSMRMKTTFTAPVNYVVDNNKIANTSIITPYADEYETIEVDTIYEFEEPRIVRSQTNSTGTDLTIELSLNSGDTYTSPIMKTGSNINPIAFRNVTGYLLTDSDIEGLTTRTITDSDTDDAAQQFASYQAAVQSELEHSAYVTDQIDLEIPADGFTVKFDADMAPSSSVEVAYKIRPLGDDTPFEELVWQDFPYAQQITEDNYGEFSSAPDKKSYTVSTGTSFEFSSFKIRLRLRTQNEAQTPKVSELRIIADI